MYQPIQHIDILENFVLHEGLTWAETLIFNYARHYKAKEDIIGYTRVFFSNAPIREAYDRLVNNFHLLAEYMEDGKIMVKVTTEFERNIVKRQAKDRKGRPRKIPLVVEEAN